jgi:NAD(P)H-flavin reductase
LNIVKFPAAGNLAAEYFHSQANIRCDILGKAYITPEIFMLEFSWPGTAPKAGQFFMLKPAQGSAFLGRPISVSLWKPTSKTLQFLIEIRGRGTRELACMNGGECVDLIGPLGNAWSDFLPSPKTVQGKKLFAFVGGGLGIAPLKALVEEAPQYNFDFYCGSKTGFVDDEERSEMLGPVLDGCNELILATEDGSEGRKGLVLDFFEPQKYAAVCVCGPAVMLKAAAAKCRAANVPCFVSMEARMACGVGACLGCTVKTAKGNRRCCADGPIFRAEDVYE